MEVEKSKILPETDTKKEEKSAKANEALSKLMQTYNFKTKAIF